MGSCIKGRSIPPTILRTRLQASHLLTTPPASFQTMLLSSTAFLFALTSAKLALAGIGVHCGTTDDATLSDCQALLYDDGIWGAAWAGTSNVCQFVAFTLPPQRAAHRGARAATRTRTAASSAARRTTPRATATVRAPSAPPHRALTLLQSLISALRGRLHLLREHGQRLAGRGPDARGRAGPPWLR